MTADIVAAHRRHTDGRGYGEGPGLTNCSLTAEAILADVYGIKIMQRHADLMIMDRARPWSNIEAMVELGIAIEVDDAPTPGRWHICQGWQSLTDGRVGDGDAGHTWLWWEPVGGGPGRLLEANRRRPWDRDLLWEKQAARYKAGVRVAALVDPRGYVEPLSRPHVTL